MSVGLACIGWRLKKRCPLLPLCRCSSKCVPRARLDLLDTGGADFCCRGGRRSGFLLETNCGYLLGCRVCSGFAAQERACRRDDANSQSSFLRRLPVRYITPAQAYDPALESPTRSYPGARGAQALLPKDPETTSSNSPSPMEAPRMNRAKKEMSCPTCQERSLLPHASALNRNALEQLKPLGKQAQVYGRALVTAPYVPTETTRLLLRRRRASHFVAPSRVCV